MVDIPKDLKLEDSVLYLNSQGVPIGLVPVDKLEAFSLAWEIAEKAKIKQGYYDESTKD